MNERAVAVVGSGGGWVDVRLCRLYHVGVITWRVIRRTDQKERQTGDGGGGEIINGNVYFSSNFRESFQRAW